MDYIIFQIWRVFRFFLSLQLKNKGLTYLQHWLLDRRITTNSMSFFIQRFFIHKIWHFLIRSIIDLLFETVSITKFIWTHKWQGSLVYICYSFGFFEVTVDNKNVYCWLQQNLIYRISFWTFVDPYLRRSVFCLGIIHPRNPSETLSARFETGELRFSSTWSDHFIWDKSYTSTNICFYWGGALPVVFWPNTFIRHFIFNLNQF